MRAVIQRVQKASVDVARETVGAINGGLVVLLGVGQEDSEEDIDYLIEKILNLRIFADESGKFNLSALDIDAEILVVSQFTLYGDCRKGRRPSFSKAAAPTVAEELYLKFVEKVKTYGLKVETGKFQAEMLVEIHNHGPVTLLLDSKKEF